MAGKKQTFEAAMRRLEEIALRLESGDAPLEESLALFEEGAKLIKECSARLDKAEQRVTRLLETEDGEPVEAPFPAED